MKVQLEQDLSIVKFSFQKYSVYFCWIWRFVSYFNFGGRVYFAVTSVKYTSCLHFGLH